MQLSELLLVRYHNRGVVRHAALLLPRDVALQFIDECQRSGQMGLLLGFDGFKIVDDNWIQPYLEFTLDLSDETHMGLSSEDKFERARRVIASATSDVHFEFVTAD